MVKKKFICAMVALVIVAMVCCACTPATSAGKRAIASVAGENTASGTVTDNTDMDTHYTLRMHNQVLTIAVGETDLVAYTYTGPGVITITTSNPQVLQVENGYYKALSPGTAVITCTDGKWNTQSIVTVTELSPPA